MMLFLLFLRFVPVMEMGEVEGVLPQSEPHFDDHPSKAPADVTPWFAMPERAWATHTVVFGHWAALGLDIGAHHVALDTGCVWGKSLTAYRLDDKMVFQAKAVEAAS